MSIIYPGFFKTANLLWKRNLLFSFNMYAAQLLILNFLLNTCYVCFESTVFPLILQLPNSNQTAVGPSTRLDINHILIIQLFFFCQGIIEMNIRFSNRRSPSVLMCTIMLKIKFLKIIFLDVAMWLLASLYHYCNHVNTPSIFSVS